MMNNLSFNDLCRHDSGWCPLKGRPKENVIAGNTCLYGATGGEAPGDKQNRGEDANCAMSTSPNDQNGWLMLVTYVTWVVYRGLLLPFITECDECDPMWH